jgi:sigma-B regulation protein RsbU (phosphoserine phosphatase)
LAYVNQHLARHYNARDGSFVTAFYGIYDPATRKLIFSCAGHNPPRLKRCGEGTLISLDGVRNFPLGIASEETYPEMTQQLRPGDILVLYTDGITEAQNPGGEMFGLNRLDGILEKCPDTADHLLRDVLAGLEQFTAGHPPDDDRTLLVATIS